MSTRLGRGAGRGIGRGDDPASSFRRIYAGRVPGHWELIVLGVVLLLLFGSKQVPQIARQLGRGVREVKQTVADVDVRDDVRRAMEPPPPARPPEAPEDEARAAGGDPRDVS